MPTRLCSIICTYGAVVRDPRSRRKIKKHPQGVLFNFGGEREIRTLAPVSRPTPLAGEPLHHLGISASVGVLPLPAIYYYGIADWFGWRRGWDSNPCEIALKRFSRPPRYDRFDTSPSFCSVQYDSTPIPLLSSAKFSFSPFIQKITKKLF